MKKYYNMSWRNVLDELDSDEIKGLREDEIKIREELYGKNYVYYSDDKGIFKGVFGVFFAPWTLILLIMISICFVLEKPVTAFYLFFLFIVMGAVTLWNRREPGVINKQLQNLNKSTAVVLRNGSKRKVSIGDIVIGDIVYLNKGSFVPADMRIIKSENLFVNELAVTGEDYHTEKFSEKLDSKNPAIISMKNMVFRSTVVTKGKGMGVVVACGMKSEIGKLLGAAFYKDTEYKNKYSLDSILNYIGLASFALCGILFLIRWGISGISAASSSIAGDMIIFNVFYLILAYIYTLSRSLNKLRTEGIKINDKDVLFRIKDIDTVMIDKYGLLTSKFYYVGGVYFNNEYKSISEIEKNKQSVTALKMLNTITTKCCSYFEEEEYDSKHKGLKVEFSILRCIFSIDKAMISHKADSRNVLEIPFDRDRNLKTVVWKQDRKHIRAATMGELDEVLNRCVSLNINGKEVTLTNEEREKIKIASYSMAKQGLKIVALAYRNYDYIPSEEENIESNLVFAGMWGIRESFESDGLDALNSFKSMDVKTIINCDENKIAATNIGREMGAIKEGVTSVAGIELDYLTRSETSKIINTCDIYSQLRTRNKINFVEVLKNSGRKLMAVGNKLKDVSYLFKCDIKVSIGANTSEILKSWSDIYIDQGSFKSVLKVLGMGRKITSKYRQVINYSIFIMAYLCVLKFIGALNGVDISMGTTVLFVLMSFLNSLVLVGRSDLKASFSDSDKKGVYLLSGTASASMMTGTAYAGVVAGVISLESVLNLLLILIGLIGVFTVVKLRVITESIFNSILFVIEVMLVWGLLFMSQSVKLLGIEANMINNSFVLGIGSLIMIVFLSVFKRIKV